MPLFDFKCPSCGSVREVLVRVAADHRQVCVHPNREGRADYSALMERQQAAPSFVVNGFNSKSGYAGERVIKTNMGNGIRTEVRGNFEGFADGLHS